MGCNKGGKGNNVNKGMKGKGKCDGKKTASGGGKLGNAKGPNIAGFANWTSSSRTYRLRRPAAVAAVAATGL